MQLPNSRLSLSPIGLALHTGPLRGQINFFFLDTRTGSSTAPVVSDGLWVARKTPVIGREGKDGEWV